ARQARDKVLDRVAALGVWTPAQLADAREEPVWLARYQAPQLAPLLARRLAAESPATVVPSTLDAGLQLRLEGLLRRWSTRLPQRTSAAVLVAELRDMRVRAYLGSVDIDDDQRFGHVDMVRALRSPGSTLKPFLYGMALDSGLIHS